MSLKQNHRVILLLLLAFPLLFLGGGCRFACEDDPEGYARPDHWTRPSHCPNVAADYSRLLVDTAVARLDITVNASDHNAAMQDLSVKLSGSSGAAIPNPIWVPVTVRHDGLTWTSVGMRYKGNTSLQDAWQKGVRKLSFRLEFDRFEDSDPELQNQRFYGFSELIFASGHGDPSLIREATAHAIFRDGGVPTVRTGFCRVYLDHGQGPVYLGLYTVMEDPTDQLLEREFGDGTGNLYKPEGDGARLATFQRDQMVKQSNEKVGDWSDVMRFIERINADRSDAASWRKALEQVFDVDGYLRLLALNQAMQNWDTYPFMPNNYYLYGDPGREGRLCWMPWDLTVSMMSKTVDSVDSGSVLLAKVTNQWPLVRYVLDDPVYLATYKSELKAALSGAFAEAQLSAAIQARHELIAPYVTGTQGEKAPYTSLSSSAEFSQSLTTGPNALIPHIKSRRASITAALGM